MYNAVYTVEIINNEMIGSIFNIYNESEKGKEKCEKDLKECFSKLFPKKKIIF